MVGELEGVDVGVSSGEPDPRKIKKATIAMATIKNPTTNQIILVPMEPFFGIFTGGGANIFGELGRGGDESCVFFISCSMVRTEARKLCGAELSGALSGFGDDGI